MTLTLQLQVNPRPRMFQGLILPDGVMVNANEFWDTFPRLARSHFSRNAIQLMNRDDDNMNDLLHIVFEGFRGQIKDRKLSKTFGITIPEAKWIKKHILKC